MKDSRKQILGMVMAGRITPLEAERLLMAWNEERESRWVFGACAAPAVVNFAHAVWLHVVSSGGCASGRGAGELDSWRCAMSEGRKQILDMLAAGKINADEAERLLGRWSRGAEVRALRREPASQASGRRRRSICACRWRRTSR